MQMQDNLMSREAQTCYTCCCMYMQTRGHLEDLKAGNVQDADEEIPSSLCVQCLVDSPHQPPEHPLVHGLREGTDGETNLEGRGGKEAYNIGKIIYMWL